jgi:hypothetical protein
MDDGMAHMVEPFCGDAAVVEDLLSEPPRRMKSECKGPMSRDRPEAAAERSKDRVRTVAKPGALDIGTHELCVDQEVAPTADPSRQDAPTRHMNT